MAAPSPSVPPRPTRSQNLQPSSTMDIPSIPPRPRSKRSTDRSISPNRDTFARSPLNDPTYIHQKSPRVKKNGNESDPQIRRPPSVSQLPTIGQEGSEYTIVDEQHLQDASPPEQTKSVGKDLPLHAPTASVPAATAKARIATVTRTDQHHGPSGLSKLVADNKDHHGVTNRSTSSLGGTRPSSIHIDEAEHGIPMIGVQVPMYPNAGDVQAPTPSQTPQHGSTGVGFFNNGGHRAGRQHTRTKSGRQVFHGPPGSYGLHGHGVTPRDPLEKSWYDKHPDDAAKEAKGEYGPKIPGMRKEYHLSQDDLNKLVHHRIAPSRGDAGTPAEELGYQVSEEYASRMASPKVGSSSPGVQAEPHRRTGSQVHAGSPLYKTISGSEITGLSLDDANESRESLGLERTVTEEDRWAREHGYDAPILAADEVAKHEFAEHLQPAVSPDFEQERRRSAEFTHGDNALRKVHSRPESRNNGSHQPSPHLSRFASHEEFEGAHTPLENVQEYEPLFPEDEQEEKLQKKPTAVEKLKRPDLSRYHFPSQDVWEDAPSHVHLSTTVETPEPEEETKVENTSPSKAFETPETEEARKGTITKEDQQNFLSDHTKKLAKSHLSAAVLADMPTRPGVKQRFPSQDIWEDAPDNVHQYTSVDTPEDELDEQDLISPVEAPQKPTIPARPAKTKTDEPSSPEKKMPALPARPKPQVPVRPVKNVHRGSNENEHSPLEKTLSAGSAGSDGTNELGSVKSKPPVPARPGGSKIASLKAGFMSDLNSRLQLGPQAPKTKEVENDAAEEVQEKAPLLDARKGRAKGPSRRKPTASPSGETTKPTLSLSIASPWTVWSVAEDGALTVGAPLENAVSKSELAVDAPHIDETEAVLPTVETAEDTLSPSLSKSPTAESSTQTGQLDIRISTPTGEKEEITAFVGGNAHGDGDIVVDKDGVEHVSGKSASPPPAPSETQSPVLEKTTVAEVDK